MRRLMILVLLLPVLAVSQVVSFVSSPSAAPAGSTLSNGLIAFWKFDGNWEDAVGSNDLTTSGSPYVSATGKSGQAASFEKDSTQYAYIIDNASLSFSGSQSYTLAAWVKYETVESSTVAGKWNNSTAKREYMLWTDSNIQMAHQISSNGVENIGAASIIPNADTWYCAILWYNASTDSAYIKIGANNIIRISSAGANDNTANFVVGARANNTVFFDGLIDDVGIWGRCPQGPTYAMADSIYNSGNGWRP